MATFVRGTAPELFEARQAQLFFMAFNEEPQHYPEVFNVMSSTKAYEDWFEVSGLGQFILKPEGTKVSYDTSVQGPRRRVVHSTFALGHRASMEAIEDEQYDVLDQMAKELGNAGRESQDLLGFGLFDDAFDGNTYTTPDALSLCNSAHTILKPKTSGATDSNVLSPAVELSVTGLEDAHTTMRLQKSREDRFMNVQPAVLLIHPNNDHRAHELLNTDKKVDSAENNVSTVSSSRTGVRPVSVPHLSDTNNWFLLADKRNHEITWHNRKGMTVQSGSDFQTKDVMTDAHYRASVAAKDWRGVVGSNPS